MLFALVTGSAAGIVVVAVLTVIGAAIAVGDMIVASWPNDRDEWPGKGRRSAQLVPLLVRDKNLPEITGSFVSWPGWRGR
jgi:hypothetical protein